MGAPSDFSRRAEINTFQRRAHPTVSQTSVPADSAVLSTERSLLSLQRCLMAVYAPKSDALYARTSTPPSFSLERKRSETQRSEDLHRKSEKGQFFSSSAPIVEFGLCPLTAYASNCPPGSDGKPCMDGQVQGLLQTTRTVWSAQSHGPVQLSRFLLLLCS